MEGKVSFVHNLLLPPARDMDSLVPLLKWPKRWLHLFPQFSRGKTEAEMEFGSLMSRLGRAEDPSETWVSQILRPHATLAGCGPTDAVFLSWQPVVSSRRGRHL